MKLRRFLTGAAIGAAIAIAIRSLGDWALPWDWDWNNRGVVIRFLIAWAASAGGMLMNAIHISFKGGQE